MMLTQPESVRSFGGILMGWIKEQWLCFDDVATAQFLPRIVPIVVRPEALPNRKVVTFVEPTRGADVFCLVRSSDLSESTLEPVCENAGMVYV
jgi:hypothetical protein